MADDDAPDDSPDASRPSAPTDDAPVDAGPPPDAEATDSDSDERIEAERAPRRRTRALDGRTLAICFLVALIAALLTGLIVSRVVDDDAEAADTDDTMAEATLDTAEGLPDDIPLERFDGTPLDLADYRGQALVVNFWGSWCTPCVQEMPDLQAVHESLGDDVAFLGVNVNDDPEDALEMVERTGVTYDLAVDVDGALVRELGVLTFPTTVLVLPDGTVIDSIQRQVDAGRLCDKINQSLLNGQLEECG